MQLSSCSLFPRQGSKESGGELGASSKAVSKLASVSLYTGAPSANSIITQKCINESDNHHDLHRDNIRTSLAFYGARCCGLRWEFVQRVGLYIMSRSCSNMSSIRFIVIIRYPETDEKWLESKEAQLTYFTPTCYGFLISSKTLCFVSGAPNEDIVQNQLT